MQCGNLNFIVGKGQQPWNRQLERVRGPRLWEWLKALTMESLTFRFHLERPRGMLSRWLQLLSLRPWLYTKPQKGGWKWEMAYIYRTCRDTGLRNEKLASGWGSQGFILLSSPQVLHEDGRRTCWGTPGELQWKWPKYIVYMCEIVKD